MSVPAIVLAAGASRRLGQPKQLVRFGGETLLERSVRVAADAGFAPIIAVLGAHREAIVQQTDLSNGAVIANPDWEQGIATSIQAGIRAVQAQAPAAVGSLLMVCDQVRLDDRHLRLLHEAFESAGQTAMVASVYGGITGIPAIFPASQFSQLLALQGDTGARLLLRDPQCPMIALPFAEGEFDLDVPADLRKL